MPDRPIRRVSLADLMAVFLHPVQTARRVSGADRPQPDPGKPLAPSMAEGSAPRAWEPAMGRNLVGPRQEQIDNLTAFATLKALVASSSLVQIAAADVVNQVSGMEWGVRVKPKFRGQEAQLAGEIEAVQRWLAMPYPLKRVRFKPWLRKVVREMLTTDALALVPRFDRAGRPLGLQHVTGSSIKPLVDATGEPPDPPEAAFQQWVQGRPETNYPLGDLWYLPMNPRSDSPYGCSPTEQILLTVNLGLRKELYDLHYYTHGTLPEELASAPDGWTDQQTRNWQEWFDAWHSGQDERRSGYLKALPGGFRLLNPHQHLFAYDENEWYARLVAWSFGVSPIPIAKVMNRATGETMEISSLEAGPRPIAAFLRDVVFAPYVEDVMGIDSLQIAPAEDETEEPATTIERHRMLVGLGGLTINELREANGQQRYKDVPNADRPFVLTATGVQYLDEVGPEAGKPNADTSGEEGAAGSAPPGRNEAEEDLERWRKVALKCVRAGRPVREFESAAIPFSVRRMIAGSLSKATTAEEVRAAFEIPFTRWRRPSPTSPPSTSPAEISPASSGGG